MRTSASNKYNKMPACIRILDSNAAAGVTEPLHRTSWMLHIRSIESINKVVVLALEMNNEHVI